MTAFKYDWLVFSDNVEPVQIHVDYHICHKLRHEMYTEVYTPIVMIFLEGVMTGKR